MPVSKALLGENVHSELLSSMTHRQQSNKVFKSNNSFEYSPLLTDTFTDQNSPKKLRWAFFCVFDRRLARSRCPFLMFGPVVSGKYCHRPVLLINALSKSKESYGWLPAQRRVQQYKMGIFTQLRL